MNGDTKYLAGYAPSRPKEWPCKPTLPFLLLSLGLVLTYTQGLAEALSLDFGQLEHYQFWRLLTSPLASLTLPQLVGNLLALLLLTILSERPKGSLAYAADLLAKSLLINLISLLLYLLTFCCAVVFSSTFDYLLELQNTTPGGGLQFVLIAEIFVALSGRERDAGEEPEAADPLPPLGYVALGLYLLVLGCLFFYAVGFVSAITLGLLLRLGVVGYLRPLLHSALLRKLEAKASFARPLLYFYNLPQSSPIFYENPDESSLESRKNIETADNSVGDVREDGAHAHHQDDEDTKSRYDDVNVNDYILENRAGGDEQKEPESFEI